MPAVIEYISAFGRMIAAVATASLELAPVISIILVEVAFMLVYDLYRLLRGGRNGY